MELDLSLNFLTSVPIGALGQLRNLKFLNLGSNRIQVCIIHHFQSAIFQPIIQTFEFYKTTKSSTLQTSCT